MTKQIEEKQSKIKEFHELIKEINKIDEPSFFNEVFQTKKQDEELELIVEIEEVKKAIKKMHLELADKIITERDSTVFDFRVTNAKSLVKYGVFDIMRELTCENLILDACIEKAKRTKERLESGYYD